MSSSSPASPPANCSHSTSKTEPEPRAPHDITLNRIANGSPGNPNHYPQNSNGSADSGSNLSPAAKEFVPKGAKEAKGPSYIPNLNKTSCLSATAKEFVPRRNEDLPPSDPLAHLSMCSVHLSSTNFNKENPVDAFKTAIYHLTTHPGNLDDYMKPVVDLLNEKQIRPTLVVEIVDILFNESISVPNFRYTGARICKYLSQLFTVNLEFRKVLLKRCEKEYLQREELIADPNTVPRLCGFSLFLAELFLLLEVDNNGVSEKYAPFRSALHSLLELLLKNNNDQTVKCATQLMKLAGATIEDTRFIGGGEQQSFADIYETLSELKDSPQLNDTCHLLINSVLNLKAKNFDRVESAAQPTTSASSAAAATELSAANDLTNEPVFFNEKGEQISRSEAGYSAEDDLTFLIEEVDLVDDEDGDHNNESDMDEEMMTDFEEYLRSNEK